MPGYVLVEGRGEVEAVGNLLSRLWADLGLPYMPWSNPMRWSKITLKESIERGCRVVATKKNADALLILHDEDDGCPAEIGPLVASWTAGLGLSFPVAVVLLHREYEVLFLPCVAEMAGRPLVGSSGQERPGLVEDALPPDDPQAIRGAKGWLSRHFPAGRSYKPTLDQLPMTRMIDFNTVRGAALPCFGTLERALKFLSTHRSAGGASYPPPANASRST